MGTNEPEEIHFSPGVEEYAQLYAQLKTLSVHLPGNLNTDHGEPLPHPSTADGIDDGKFKIGIEGLPVNAPNPSTTAAQDQDPAACYAKIPPLLPPLQCHAVLEKVLHRKIPPIQIRGTPTTQKRNANFEKVGPYSAPVSPAPSQPRLALKYKVTYAAEN